MRIHINFGVVTQETTGGVTQYFAEAEISPRCILSRSGFYRGQKEADKMESDKLKTGDLVIRHNWEDRSWGTPELVLVVWANNYIFNAIDRHGQMISQPQDLTQGYQILQRIDMYGVQDV